jgi:hypothetical protein
MPIIDILTGEERIIFNCMLPFLIEKTGKKAIAKSGMPGLLKAGTVVI